jgi:hypothetical protein
MDPKPLGNRLIHRVSRIESSGGVLKYKLDATAVCLECLARIAERFTVNEDRSLSGAFQAK